MKNNSNINISIVATLIFIVSIIVTISCLIFEGHIFINNKIEKEESQTTKNTKNINLNIQDYNKYSIIREEDTSFPGRVRKSIYIMLNETKDLSQETIYKTAMAASAIYQYQTGADLASAYILTTQNKESLIGPIAMSNYAKDGGGFSGNDSWTWYVDSVKSYPTQTQIRISEEWYNMRDDFLEAPNPKFPTIKTPNEDKLKKAIAEKLNTPVTKVGNTSLYTNSIDIYYGIREIIIKK